MGRDTASYIMLVISMLLVQVLICNHIMLFSVAVPIIFFYPILRLPGSMSVKAVMTVAFLLGLTVDIFSDTPGVNTLSCTVLAVMRRPVLHSFTGNDDTLSSVSPCIATLGFWTCFKYLLICVSSYCLMSVALEYFTFVSLQRTLSIIAASTLVSFVLLLGVDSLTGGKS